MNQPVKMGVRKAYLIEMSNGRKIQIDPDELPIVIASIRKGVPVKVKQGFFNPSFFVDIIQDKDRLYLIKERIDKEIPPLLDIFENMNLKLVEGPSGFKKLEAPK